MAVDHAHVGEMLAKQWGFPPELVTVIRRHHDPLALEVPMVRRSVAVADLVAKELKIGYDGDDGLNEGLSKLQSKLEISEEEYEHLKGLRLASGETSKGFSKSPPDLESRLSWR